MRRASAGANASYNEAGWCVFKLSIISTMHFLAGWPRVGNRPRPPGRLPGLDRIVATWMRDTARKLERIRFQFDYELQRKDSGWLGHNGRTYRKYKAVTEFSSKPGFLQFVSAHEIGSILFSQAVPVRFALGVPTGQIPWFHPNSISTAPKPLKTALVRSRFAMLYCLVNDPDMIRSPGWRL